MREGGEKSGERMMGMAIREDVMRRGRSEGTLDGGKVQKRRGAAVEGGGKGQSGGAFKTRCDVITNRASDRYSEHSKREYHEPHKDSWD